MQIPLALVCLLRREIGLFLIFAGLWGGAAAFAGESSASLSESPQKAAFCMLDGGVNPLSWESELRLRVDGLEVHDKDMGNWRITLNTVPFKVVHCFVSPGARDPGLHTEVLIVLDGVDCGSADKTPQQVAAAMAAAIRRLAPNRWGANRVAVEVSLNGTPLIPVLKTGEPLSAAELEFELISWPRRWICAAALAAIAGIFYWAGTRTGALRDSDALNPDFRQRTFSLARCQLAFWTILVVGSFLYIYMVTGVTSGVLTTTALWLLGISSGTSVLAQAAGNTAASAVPSIPQRSNGFVADILSDSQGVNVHRLQMLIWTVVFGCILVAHVVTRLAFPDYDTTTYALMGISSGTYIWFKRTET